MNQPDPAATPTSSPRGESASQIFRRLGPAGVLGAIAAILPALGGWVLLIYIRTVADWLRDHGSAGLVIYIAAFALGAGLALLPTYAQSILGGYAFGLAIGAPAALAGFAAAAVIGYEIARRASGERVMTVIEEKPKWLAVRNALVADRDMLATEGGGETSPTGAHFLRTLGMVILLRLPPNSPFALTNLVMASVRVPRLAFVLGTLIGMAPRTVVAVWLGAGIQELTRDAIKNTPWWYFAATVVLGLAVLAVIGAIANRAIERVTAGAAPGAPVQPAVAATEQ